MHMETGVFGQLGTDGASPEVFRARVVIPRTEFARLSLGDHERPGTLPACFRWLLALFGPGGDRWSVRLREGEDAIVHFAQQADAFGFFARWNAPQGTGPRHQQAA
jgi:hypothetical protein